MPASPSLLIVPARFKTGKLYTQIATTSAGVVLASSGDFNVTRATTATRFNSAGNIESVASGVPRLDYYTSGGTAGCPALLVEASAANSLLHSEAFDNAYWTKNGTTAQGDVAISPSNTLTADNIYPTVSGSDQRLQRAISIVNGTTYTSSIFAKANGINWIKFFAAQFNAAAWFDVQSGTIGTVQAGVTARIENYGNGWYRCSVTQTVTTTGTGQFYINLANGNNTSNVTASGTNGVLFWGAQLETGSIATSYIPTTTAAVTRNADVISVTGAVSGCIGQTEGTVYLDFQFLSHNKFPSLRNIPLTIYAPSSGQLYFYFDSFKIQADYAVGASIQASIATAAGFATYGANYKFAFAYKQNDFAFYINGTQIGVDTSGNVSALNDIAFGYPLAADYDGGNRIRAVALYTTRLSNAELAALTTP